MLYAAVRVRSGGRIFAGHNAARPQHAIRHAPSPNRTWPKAKSQGIGAQIASHKSNRGGRQADRPEQGKWFNHRWRRTRPKSRIGEPKRPFAGEIARDQTLPARELTRPATHYLAANDVRKGRQRRHTDNPNPSIPARKETRKFHSVRCHITRPARASCAHRGGRTSKQSANPKHKPGYKSAIPKPNVAGKPQINAQSRAHSTLILDTEHAPFLPARRKSPRNKHRSAPIKPQTISGQ